MAAERLASIQINHLRRLVSNSGVLVETRNRGGAVIYGSANARSDTVDRIDRGFRPHGTCPGAEWRVVRIG